MTFVNAVGYHNKYLLGSLGSNIITGRALAKTKHFRGGKGEGTGGSCPPPLATPMPKTWLGLITIGLIARKYCERVSENRGENRGALTRGRGAHKRCVAWTFYGGTYFIPHHTPNYQYSFTCQSHLVNNSSTWVGLLIVLLLYKNEYRTQQITKHPYTFYLIINVLTKLDLKPIINCPVSSSKHNLFGSPSSLLWSQSSNTRWRRSSASSCSTRRFPLSATRTRSPASSARLRGNRSSSRVPPRCPPNVRTTTPLRSISLT